MNEKETFLEAALAVDPVSENFDPNVIPANGMEYLQHVQYEAKMCDQVVTASIDVRKFDKKRTANFHCLPKVDIKQEEFLPSIELQNEWIADFSEVRQTVERRRSIQFEHKSHKFSIPIVESEEGWFKFCVGVTTDSKAEDEMIINEEVTAKLDRECTLNKEMEHDEDNKPVVAFQRSSLLRNEPHLHLLASMSQITITAVLDYHIDWLSNDKTDFAHSGSWLYALLACLEIPLTPETCSSIRSLARIAAEHRSKIETVNELLGTLNLLICLVGRYFRQCDLADG